MNALTPTDWTAHYKAVRLRLGMGPAKPVVNVKRAIVEKANNPDEIELTPQQVAQIKYIKKYILKRRHRLDRTNYKFPIIIPNAAQMEEVIAAQARLANMPCEIPVKGILNDVAEHYGVTVEDLRGASRVHWVSFSRMIAIWLLKQNNPKRKLTEIGKALNKDHTTVLYALRKMAGMMESGEVRLPPHLLALTKPVGVEG